MRFFLLASLCLAAGVGTAGPVQFFHLLGHVRDFSDEAEVAEAVQRAHRLTSAEMDHVETLGIINAIAWSPSATAESQFGVLLYLIESLARNPHAHVARWKEAILDQVRTQGIPEPLRGHLEEAIKKTEARARGKKRLWGALGLTGVTVFTGLVSTLGYLVGPVGAGLLYTPIIGDLAILGSLLMSGGAPLQPGETAENRYALLMGVAAGALALKYVPPILGGVGIKKWFRWSRVLKAQTCAAGLALQPLTD